VGFGAAADRVSDFAVRIAALSAAGLGKSVARSVGSSTDCVIDQRRLTLPLLRARNQPAESERLPRMWQFSWLPRWMVTGAVFCWALVQLIERLARYWARERRS